MLRSFASASKIPFGARAVCGSSALDSCQYLADVSPISLLASREVIKICSDEWNSRDLEEREDLLGNVDTEQWEGRGLDATPATMLRVTDSGSCACSAGVHKSRDPVNHFTGRAFDAKGEAVWFFDKNHRYFTNAVHFYPGGLPADYDKNRFAYTPSNDSNLVAWCTAYRWDIKTGKKIQN
ncbi:hypothetical protein ACEPAI_2845 [Sanghuangporus weigelae]